MMVSQASSMKLQNIFSLRAGADTVPNSGVHRTIFGGGWHASRQVKTNIIRIAVFVYGDLLPSVVSDPAQASSFSPHFRLLDDQDMAAHKRGQFRVRALVEFCLP